MAGICVAFTVRGTPAQRASVIRAAKKAAAAEEAAEGFEVTVCHAEGRVWIMCPDLGSPFVTAVGRSVRQRAREAGQPLPAP